MSATRIAVFDLDGTVTRTDTYVDFLLYCMRQNPVRLLCLPALTAYLLVHKAGLRSNHWLKARYLSSVAGGMTRDELESTSEQFVNRTMLTNIKQPAIDELKKLRDEGFTLVLATASFGFYVHRLASLLEFDEVLCTEAQFDSDDKLTGVIDGDNCIGQEKARRIKELMNERGWGSVELGYSDSKVDLPMLEMAGRALVIDPRSATEQVAIDRGYEVLRWR